MSVTPTQTLRADVGSAEVKSCGHLPHVQALVTIEWLASHRFLVVRVLVSGRSRSRCLHLK